MRKEALHINTQELMKNKAQQHNARQTVKRWNMKNSKQAKCYPETTTPLASGIFAPSAAFHTASDPL